MNDLVIPGKCCVSFSLYPGFILNFKVLFSYNPVNALLVLWHTEHHRIQSS